ncbi:MAG TPA: hypothetical protein V6C65_39405 [Allocoleopsis sp.]
MTSKTPHPLEQEELIQCRLNEAGYSFRKLNMTTWEVIDIRQGTNYALTIRNAQYYCIPMHGTEPGARAIEQLVRQAVST